MEGTIMINQSIHFEVSGSDASNLLSACHRRGIQPIDVFNQFLAEFTKNIRGDDGDNDSYNGYNKETINYLLLSDEEKGYTMYESADELFAELDSDEVLS